MVHERNASEKIDKNIQEEILNLFKDEEKQMDEPDYEKFCDNVFMAASIAEENGFVKGFQYAFWLCSECIRE